MAGHSKWKQIKHKKAAADTKKSKIFSKVLRAIAIAARDEANPDYNPRLRTCIEKARAENVPNENIERALLKSQENETLQEMVIEAYGPEGVALIIEAVTDNTNRTIAETRVILSEHNAKIATPGSVLWLFEHNETPPRWKPKFQKTISPDAARALRALHKAIMEHPDIQTIITDSE